MYTMRSAFIRWLKLHNEEWRISGYVRIPNWFRWYIRNNCDWTYNISNCREYNYFHQNIIEENNKRRFKGNYQFEISDKELLNLQRAAWIK